MFFCIYGFLKLNISRLSEIEKVKNYSFDIRKHYLLDAHVLTRSVGEIVELQFFKSSNIAI